MRVKITYDIINNLFFYICTNNIKKVFIIMNLFNVLSHEPDLAVLTIFVSKNNIYSFARIELDVKFFRIILCKLQQTT